MMDRAWYNLWLDGRLSQPFEMNCWLWLVVYRIWLPTIDHLHSTQLNHSKFGRIALRVPVHQHPIPPSITASINDLNVSSQVSYSSPCIDLLSVLLRSCTWCSVMRVIQGGGEGDHVGWYASYLYVLSLWRVSEWWAYDQVITNIPSNVSDNFYSIWAGISSLDQPSPYRRRRVPI